MSIPIASACGASATAGSLWLSPSPTRPSWFGPGAVAPGAPPKRGITRTPITAAGVAGVVDYAMYYEDPYHGGWTASRIGTPEQNAKVYANASPLSHVDRLERPLLVLHGTSDVNVPYLHSVRLIDELLKKGKGDLVSFMTYPGEFHYFTREHVLRDAWHRVEDFFNANLKGTTVSSH